MAGLKDKAYDIIRGNIITCKYPPGSFLNEAQLLEEIGVSRTPIREALSKLEQEQFVRVVPKRGILVCELTLKEISDVYQVRILMEPQLVSRWGSAIPVDRMEACRTLLLSYTPEMDLARRNELDDSLHRLIIDSNPNRYLRQWMSHLYSQNERIRFFTGQIGRLMERNNAEHLRIVDRLLLSDWEEAASLLTEHLETARRNTLDALLSMEK